MSESESVAAPGGRPPLPVEARRVVYLMLFRVVLVTILFGVVLVVSLARGPAPDFSAPQTQFLFVLVALAYALALLYAFALRRVRRYGRFFAGQVAGDVLLVSALCHATGGLNSVYTVLYPLVIIEAAIVGLRAGAVYATLATTASFLIVVLGGWAELIPALPGQEVLPSQAAADEVARQIGLNVGGHLGVGILSAFLGDQLQRVSRRVEEQEIEIVDMAAQSERIVASLHSGLITTDPSGRVLTVNAKACTLIGRDAAALVGEPLSSLLPDVLPDLAALVGPVSRRAELPTPVEITVSRLLDREDGGAGAEADGAGAAAERGYLVLIVDRTAMRDMEARVLQAERLAVLGRLAAGVAHEIRNPLAALSGALELLHEAPVGDEDRRLLGIAMREVDRLDQLIGELLAFARPRPPEPAPFDVAALARDVAASCRTDPLFVDVELTVEAPAALTVVADPGQVQQVLWNLLKNAAQALPKAESGAPRRIDVALADREAAGWEIAVSDSGRGIPEAERDQVFEPFYTTKAKGSGLGLATIRRVVDDHGGRIRIAFGDTGGAKFTVRFPARQADDVGKGGADDDARAVG